MKKVILLGKGDLAIRICEWFLADPHHELVCIVPVMPEPTWTGSLASWAQSNNINFVKSGHYKDTPNPEEADLVMSVFYDKILRERFIGRCKRVINLHNSPLPKYRGVSPINWALKDEQEEHGVTIHDILPGIDDGSIIGQVKYSIYPDFEEVRDVYKKAIRYGYTLLENTIPILDEITPRPQDERDVIYHSSKDNHLLKERRFFTKELSLKEMEQK